MQYATLLLAALSATASALPNSSTAVPSPSRTHTPEPAVYATSEAQHVHVGALNLPKGWDNTFSLMQTPSNNCEVRVASSVCNGTTSKIANYNEDDGLCHADSIYGREHGERLPINGCPTYFVTLYFPKHKDQNANSTVEWGQLGISASDVDVEDRIDLGVRANCAVGQRHQSSTYLKSCLGKLNL